MLCSRLGQRVFAKKHAVTVRCNASVASSPTPDGIHNAGSTWSANQHLPPLIYHPRPHGIPAAVLHFRSHHVHLLDIFTHFASYSGSALGIPISKPANLPIKRSLWTVIKGPFIHKKSQENFERLVHKRCIKAWDADPVVIGFWESYLREYQVPGVGLRFIRWERAPIDYMGPADIEAYQSNIRGTKQANKKGRPKKLTQSDLQEITSATAAEYYKQSLLSDIQDAKDAGPLREALEMMQGKHQGVLPSHGDHSAQSSPEEQTPHSTAAEETKLETERNETDNPDGSAPTREDLDRDSTVGPEKT